MLINVFKVEALISNILGVVGAISTILTGIVFKNDKNDKTIIKKIFPRFFRKPIFEAQIVNKKIYVRGQDSISFRSKYVGTIKNGYFMNEIFVPLKDPKYQHLYNFTYATPNICNNGLSAKSYCPSTISNSDDKSGILNKWIKTIDWID